MTLRIPGMKQMTNATAKEYLRLAYQRVIVPESDGSFRAEIAEFPGCMALAETKAAALDKIEDAAESWIEAALEQGQTIPAPLESHGYSGKLILRLPRSLHRKAARCADMDRVSLNNFITTALAMYVGERTPAKQQMTRQSTSLVMKLSQQNNTVFLFSSSGHLQNPVSQPMPTIATHFPTFISQPVRA